MGEMKPGLVQAVQVRSREERHYVSAQTAADALHTASELLSVTKPTMARPFIANGTERGFTVRFGYDEPSGSPETWANVFISDQENPVGVTVEFRFQKRYLYNKVASKAFLVFFNLCLLAIFLDDISQNGFYLKKNQMAIGWIFALAFVPTSLAYIFQRDRDTPERSRMGQFLCEEFRLTRISEIDKVQSDRTPAIQPSNEVVG